MNDAAPENVSSAMPPAVAPRRGARFKWFPLLVIAAAAVWWIRQAMQGEYLTVIHSLVVLATVVLVSAWYLFFGWSRWRVRLAVLAVCWLTLVGLRLCFRPIYNGEVGVIGWHWRFAHVDDELTRELGAQGEAADWHTTPHDYPRFLGSGYWAEVPGVELDTDWKAHPPQEVWRREIGEGWSAFAVVGDYAVTQEQRGEFEWVTCYRVESGELVWAHADKTRFDPADFAGSLGGVGPRATPTLHDGKVLTQGATGLVNCLDARTGHVIWSHDTAAETGASVASWGKSGSPLVVDDMVIVSVGAPSDPVAREKFNSSLVAYDLETGDVRWAAGNRQASYASPVAATLAGERQILVINENYVTAHRATDGTILWEHPWPGETDGRASVSQPVPLEGDRVFLSKGYGIGASLLHVARNEAGALEARPLWSQPILPVMKTKMSNILLRDGFVYGLDGPLLQCIDLETGAERWKKRRRPQFGHGQVLLVGGVILVLTETGELVAVEASPERYHELGGIQALDADDVSWNNPAFAPPYLLVRNAHEAVCYRLALVE